MPTNAPPKNTALMPLETPLVLQQMLEQRGSKLSAGLEGTGISTGRFIAGVVQAVAKNPDLMQCTRESVLLACLEAAQAGLEPTGLLNEAWLIPYGTTARLLIGYRGYVNLLERSGVYDFLEANLVYANDEFEWRKGTNPSIHHLPAKEDRGAVIGGYWVAWKKGSDRPQFGVMSYADLEKRRKVSKKPTSGIWADWTEEMYVKTVLRWGLKSMVLTPIVRRVMAYEDESETIPVAETSDGNGGELSDRRKRLLDRVSGSHGDGLSGAEAPEAAPEAVETQEPPSVADDGLPEMPEVVEVAPGQESLGLD